VDGGGFGKGIGICEEEWVIVSLVVDKCIIAFVFVVGLNFEELVRNVGRPFNTIDLS
jgi:hypothetical protein